MLRSSSRVLRAALRPAVRMSTQLRVAARRPAVAAVAKRQMSNDSESYWPATATVQHKAPDFTATALVGDEFKEIKLSDYKGKWTVLFFWPLDFTFVCPTEILAFSDRAKEFKAIGAELIGCSIDSKFVHLAWTKSPRKAGGLGGKVNFPVIADVSKRIAADYGVLVDKGADEGIALRGLFIIDPQGIVRQITINDLPVGRSVDETLRLLQAFQYVEKHGEVCPADWKPGQASMKADPEGAKGYWSKLKN